MAYLDNTVEYGFGQMGSGHIKAVASDLVDNDEVCFKTPIELMLGLEY